MDVWVFGGQKGGVGRTTLSVNLAVAAVKAGLKVAILDLDPNKTGVGWWKHRVEHLKKDDEPSVAAANYQRLERLIDIARERGVDLVIIDCPPSFDVILKAAYEVASLVILPMRGSEVEASAFLGDMKHLGDAKEQKKVVLVANAIPTKSPGTSLSVCRMVADELGIPLLESHVRNLQSFYRTWTSGRGVVEVGGRDHAEAASDINALYDELSALRIAVRSRATGRRQAARVK